MNRNQFLSFAGKLRKFALQLDSDARRISLSGHSYKELADETREKAEGLRRIAKIIEDKFG